MISPPYLQKGDTVAIICMAGKTSLKTIEKAINCFENWGLHVIIGDTVGAACGIFGGDDILRTADFQKYLNDNQIKAIFAARGGYGSTRFLDNINWRKFKKYPKWIVGFSDITAVLTQINNIGIEAIHGPMPKMFGNIGGEKSEEYLRKTLFGNEISYTTKIQKSNIYGYAQAEVVGGNLCMLAHSIGSKSEINTNGKILFIEDIAEYYYNIDRMIVQLKRAGKFKNLAGLIIGHFTDCKESDNPFNKTIEEIVLEQTREYNFPIAFGIPIGHENENWPIVVGKMARFTVNQLKVTLDFR